MSLGKVMLNLVEYWERRAPNELGTGHPMLDAPIQRSDLDMANELERLLAECDSLLDGEACVDENPTTEFIPKSIPAIPELQNRHTIPFYIVQSDGSRTRIEVPLFTLLDNTLGTVELTCTFPDGSTDDFILPEETVIHILCGNIEEAGESIRDTERAPEWVKEYFAPWIEGE